MWRAAWVFVAVAFAIPVVHGLSVRQSPGIASIDSKGLPVNAPLSPATGNPLPRALAVADIEVNANADIFVGNNGINGISDGGLIERIVEKDGAKCDSLGLVASLAGPDAGVVALRQRIAGVADNATDVRAFSVSGHSRIAVAAPSSNTVTIFGHVSTESSTLKVVQTLSGTPPNPAIVLPFELGQRLFLFVASENVAADGALFIYDELSQQFLYNLTVSNTSACVDASFISGMTGANSTAGFLIVMRADIAGPASTTSRKLIWNETTDQVSVSSLLQGVSISDARGIETLVMPSTSNIRKVFVAFVSRSNASHGVEGSSVMISLFNTASGELQVVAVLPAMGATAATFMDIAGVPFLVVAEDGVPQNATLSNLTGGSTRIWREDASTGSWVEHQVVSTQALGFSGSVTWTAVWQSLQTKLSASQETLLLLAQSGMSRILRFRFPPGAPPEVALNAERGRFAPLGTIDVSADCAPGLRRWAFAPEFRKNTNPGLLVGIGSTALCVLEI